ncbi:HypC/HybG/HupF family hydrogenase formation chaperone [Candidatus Poribacteria bacterium]|nr:MAG: HypC/HybG/HupF family hydrogenase formation chaperone [Candidatus Poribacteria bacterium]
MCVAIPMRVVEKEGDMGVVELGGVRRRVSLQLLDDVEVGDYVIVHAGFAIEKLDEETARETLELFESLGVID